MTDEELIKRLRLQSEHVPAGTIFDAAADRIEKLVESIKNLSHLWATVAVNREVSEGKLEKAVDVIKQIIATSHADDYFAWDTALDDGIDFIAELEKKE